MPNILSTAAVFLALGGTALAAGLRANSVTSATVRNGSLLSADLKDGAGVTGADAADGSLTGADLANGSLSGAKVADGSLTGADFAPGSLGAADLAKGAFGSADIAEGAITGSDFAPGSLEDEQIDASTLGPVPDTQRLNNRTAGEFLSSHIRVVRSGDMEAEPLKGLGVRAHFGCKEGDTLISGGPADLNATSAVLDMFVEKGKSGTGKNELFVIVDPNQMLDKFAIALVCAPPGAPE